jgi:DNA-binding CsgD family transcriptional regulator
VRCGALPLAEHAREEIRATGARPRSEPTGGVDALTPSELRVARMAAGGLTNPEIAQALFVTSKTVEYHLRHVFQKLDVSSRRQLRSIVPD